MHLDQPNYTKLLRSVFFICLFFLVPIISIAQVNEDFESGTASGWTTSGTANTGTFIVANPTEETSTVVTQPEDDNTPAPGVNAYFTATNVSAGNADVDGGTAITTSPVYYTSVTSDLAISYFFGQRDSGDDANDFFLLEYSLNNGTTFIPLVSIGDVQTVATWQDATVVIPAGSNVVVRVTVSDGGGGGDIIEGGIDDFSITPQVPIMTIDDFVVDEDVGTIDFVVTMTGYPTTGPFTLFYQTNGGSASGGGIDFTDNIGSLNFNGTLNDTETITVSIIDDGLIEFTENFQLQFTYATDPSVDVSDISTVTINDNDTVIVTDGSTTNKCDGSVFDTGGIFGQYSRNEDITFTICPDANGSDLNINFTSFDVESFNDILRVYQGTSAAGTLIGAYHNSNLPPANITSTDASGCLTFRFTSNGTLNLNGWEGIISCIPRFSALTIDDLTVDEDAGTMDFNVEHTGLATSGPFVITYSTVNGSAIAGNDFTGVTSGTLNFSGIPGDINSVIIPINDDTLYELAPEDFTLQFTASSDTSVDISDIGNGTINDNEIVLGNTPLTLVEELDGYIDYTSTGGSLRNQPNGSNACSFVTSSSNTLTSAIPAGATVEKAILYWSNSGAMDQTVSFEGVQVDASLVYRTTQVGLEFHNHSADVTTMLQAMPDPTNNIFNFSGLTIDNTGEYCSRGLTLGGWALMVFYQAPGLAASTINLYQGFDGSQNSTTSFGLSGFYAIGSTGAKTTLLSWEGDQSLANNESLQFNTPLTGNNTLTGDGDNTTGNNPFNSTIYDNVGIPNTNDATQYGLDLDTYDVSSFIITGESSATTTVNVGQDFVMMNAVVLKVPSNLVTGTVFEDINYGGGAGRDLTSSSGVPIPNATLELYNSSNILLNTTTSDALGVYTFSGMADGAYSIRVVNNTVRSTRGGGVACTVCIPIQTFKTDYVNSVLVSEINKVGGENPAVNDAPAFTLIGAQSVSVLTIGSEGVAEMDFGFNFNTIVNTNEDGQGSLEQFIVNSNSLDENGLDIEANSIFDPIAGDDTAVFMIPSIADPLGRTADANFVSGYFDITISNANPLTAIIDNNTTIDGRTQTAYSGDTNVGTIGSGGTAVGTSGILLPNYELPEIQVYGADGDVFKIFGTNATIRNLAINANNNAGVLIQNGTATITNNLIGLDALGTAVGNSNSGIEVTGGTAVIDGNYISDNTDQGIWVNGGTSTVIENNHITNNGTWSCNDNIYLNAGTGIVIQQNLIENTPSIGIDAAAISGDVIITENTITGSGQDGNYCGSQIKDMGIELGGSNSQITNNRIYTNGGAGISLMGSGSGNLISQNSFYANGTNAPSLGIDILNDGVTLNDLADADNGPNGSINFPIITASYIGGNVLTIRGWSRPGATIEWFLTDINEGTAATGDNQIGLTTDYGEGQTYFATFIEGSATDLDSSNSSYTDDDGNNDTTNKFHFVVSIPAGIQVNDLITATATIRNSTSEFSPFSIIKTPTVITNRRITHRVNKN